jgi:hypothetical protein
MAISFLLIKKIPLLDSLALFLSPSGENSPQKNPDMYT